MDPISTPTFFISTALPYVNAAPHLGFALELVIADVIARAQRQNGFDVRFVSGTDDHSLKNVTTAERAGVSVQELIDHNAQRFQDLHEPLAISLDAFVRTSGNPFHVNHVQEVWRSLERADDLYLRDYHGLYCVGCERFYEPEELVEGKCSEHPTTLESCSERNWFFRLARYREALLEILETERVRIEPEAARREVLQFLRGEARDLSVSRDAIRARGFGIAVPSDESQVVYVWVDALFGYLSALRGDRERYWSQAHERVHVIGKGITRFHAVYWLALLLATGQQLPTRILVHGYLTVDGQKISKTGQSVDPLPLIDAYGSDAIRYYLLRHIKTARDGDFSQARLARAHDAELSNQLGNLVSRVLALVERYAASRVPTAAEKTSADQALLTSAAELSPAVTSAIDAFQLDRGLDLIFAFIDAANHYVDRQAPWILAKRGETVRLATVLCCLCRALLAIGQALRPYLPQSSRIILAALGASETDLECRGNVITRPGPLFPRRGQANGEPLGKRQNA
jgi:methionyl-tRNA synthetase